MAVTDRLHMHELLAAHLDWCRQRNLRPGYIESRRRNITQLGAELEHSPETATEPMLSHWYATITARVTPPARAVMLSHVTNYFRWLVREGHRDDDPTVRLVRPRVPRRYPRPIGADDLSRALSVAPERVKPWLYLAALCGLRACEIASLRAEDLRYDLEPPVVHIADGKGGKGRIVPMHPKVHAVLLASDLPARGYVFLHWYGPGPPKAWNVSHGANVYLHSLGITSTLHTLRHWYISEVYRASLDLRLAQELAGHSDPATTAGYAAWAPHRAHEVVRALDYG